MQQVETQGQQFVQIRNQITGRDDRMQKNVKQGLFDLIRAVSLDKFRLRVEIYQQVKQLCEKHQLTRYLTNPTLVSFDLGEFLTHINCFYGDSVEQILEKRIKDDYKKIVLRKVRPKQSISVDVKESKKTKHATLPSLEITNPHSYRNQLLRKLTAVSNNKGTST
ncbi:hypothetical protein [Microscilla marina]|uniref:Uncharacterized protein n=1 Tax=Microscilla marina ATCC 23134 TaxID=313606 RepID=A1ZJW8_MICM2|nr:hypothetical protein [Microscilla marina]EAY29421.1 hypothetical protein M23134_01481 [Microscilla marina ATCC 23134]